MANDIYVYFDGEGTLKERLSSPVRANGRGNRIYASLEGDEAGEGYSYVTASFRYVGSRQWELKPTEPSNGYIPTNVTDPRYFSKTKRYRFNFVNIPSAVLDAGGTWEVRFDYHQSDGNVYPSGRFTFQVEDREPSVGSTITIDQYNELLEAIESGIGGCTFEEDEETGIVTFFK